MIVSSINLFSAILLIGVAQGLFLGLAILTAPKRPNHTNAFLASLVFAFVLELANRFFVESGYIAIFPKALSLNWALDTVFGPLMYLYTRNLAKQVSDPTRTQDWRHFVLPLLSTALSLFLWLEYTNDDYLNLIDRSAPAPLRTAEVLLALAGLLSMIYYLGQSFSVLRSHRQRIAANYSYLEKIDLKWLRNLLSVMAVLLALYVSLTISGWYAEVFDHIYALSMVAAVFGIGFLGIKQPDLFVRRAEGQAEFVSGSSGRESIQDTKYKKSALSDSEAISIFEAINNLMDSDFVYLQNDLSLPRLADQLRLPSHYVSQAINQGSGTNFFEYVNRRRVQYATERLAASAGNRSTTILEIAMDAGFNSKSAFYSAFRNHTGQTPTQFQKALVPVSDGQNTATP